MAFQLPFRDSSATENRPHRQLSFQLPFRDSIPPPYLWTPGGSPFNSLFGIPSHYRFFAQDVSRSFNSLFGIPRIYSSEDGSSAHILSTPFSGFPSGAGLVEHGDSFQLPFRDSTPSSSSWSGGSRMTFNSLFGIQLGASRPDLELDFQLPFRDSYWRECPLLVVGEEAFQLPFRDSRAPGGAGAGRPPARRPFNSLFGIPS